MRPVLVLVCASALILGLGFYWQPSLATLIALNDARRTSIAMPAELDCGQAERAVELTRRMSNGLITFTEEGDMEMPRMVWEQIAEAERLALAKIVGQAHRCRPDAVGEAEVLDSGTGEVLYRVPAGQ